MEETSGSSRRGGGDRGGETEKTSSASPRPKPAAAMRRPRCGHGQGGRKEYRATVSHRCVILGLAGPDCATIPRSSEIEKED